MCYINLTHVSVVWDRRKAIFVYDRLHAITKEISAGRCKFLSRFIRKREPSLVLCEVGCGLVVSAAACGGVGANVGVSFLFSSRAMVVVAAGTAGACVSSVTTTFATR